MIYEAYEARMLKIAAVIAKIKKYRVLIISVLCAILALLCAFLATKGIIIENTVADSDTFTYGSLPSFSGKALFGRLSYEYKPENASDDEWTEEVPRIPGEYLVRAVSRRIFGILSYGEPIKITMKQKEITVSLAEKNIVYGTEPSLSAELVYGDCISGFDYTYSDPYALSTELCVTPQTLKIVATDGMDVSVAYAVTFKEMGVNIKPREIEITFADAEKEYDGTPLSSNEYTVGEGQLVEGDKISLGEALSVTDYKDGGYENVSSVSFLSSEGKDVSHFYNKKVNSGRLTITKRPITVESVGASKIFDGERLSAKGIKITAGSLVSGHKIFEQYTKKAIYAGEYDNTFDVKILCSDGKDITKNYSVEKNPGKLSIAKRTVRIRLSDYSWIYDGRNHTGNGLSPNYTALSPEKNEGLISGYTLSVTSKSSIINVGDVKNELGSYTVKNTEGVDVTSSFKVVAEGGTLSVTARPIVVTLTDGRVEYDGKEHTGAELLSSAQLALGTSAASASSASTDNEYSDSVLSALGIGDVVTYTGVGGGKSVGSHTYGATVKITNAEGKDVTANYKVTVEKASIEIYQRKIGVTTATESFVYDGQYHTSVSGNYATEYLGTAGSAFALCDSHTVKIKSSVSVKNVCSVDNVSEYIRIYDENKKDVTENYDITECYGKINVTRRPITVTMQNGEWEYDGAVHKGTDVPVYFKIEYTGESELAGVVLGECATVESIGEIRYVGEKVHSSGEILISDGNENTTENYEITRVEGNLVVTQRKITLSSLTKSKVYNATPLKYHEYRVIHGSIAPGDSITAISFTASQTDAGTNENLFYVSEIRNSTDNVTDCYLISYEYGTLEVTKRPIKLIANSETFVYDSTVKRGVELGYEIEKSDSLLTSYGHRIELVNNSEILNVGSADNVIESVRIMAGVADLTENYLVTTVKGKLTVTKREILIVTEDISKVYDGTPLESGATQTMYYAPGGNIDYSESALGVNDSVSKYDTKSIKFVWESGVDNHYEITEIFSVNSWIGTGSNSFDLMENYDIKYDYGTMAITRRPISVTATDVDFTYDGSWQNAPSADNVIYAVGDLGEGNPTLTAVTEGRIKDVGQTPHKVVSISVFLGNVDITDNFEPQYVNGVLRVYPRNITVTSASKDKIYDKSPLTCHEIESVQNLVNGHYIAEDGAIFTGSQTEVGESGNSFTVTLILDADKNDVTDNYTISYIDGTLRVVSGIITVYTGSDEKIYNGEALTNSEIFYEGKLLPGHQIFLAATGSQTNFGSSENTYEVTVKNGTEDVTDRYKFVNNLGTLNVLKRSITVTSAGNEKVYDGNALTCHEIENVQNLVNGHYIAEDGAIFTGSQTEVGESGNSFTVTLILDEDKNDVTDNYEINYEYGTLKVLPIKITVKTESAEKVYDGEALTNEALTYKGSLILGHEIIIEATGSQTEVGESENTFVAKVMFGSKDVTHIYDFSDYELGTLTVKSIPLTIESGSDEKIYDGDTLICHSAEITSGALVDGDTIQYSFSGSQTEKGKSNNTFTYAIYDSEGVLIQDENTPKKESKYEITKVLGILEVKNEDGEEDGDDEGGGSGGNGLGGAGSDTGDINGPTPDLSELEKIEILKLTADFSGKVLLREAHYGDYTLNGWKAAPKGESVNGLYFTAEAYKYVGSQKNNVTIEKNNVTIELIDGVSYVIPYYPEMSDINSALREYSISAYRGSLEGLEHSAEWKALEEAYREFVYQNYTDLPQSTRTSMLEILGEALKGTSITPGNNLEFIYWVEEYVRNAAPYDLEGGAPDGVDTAVWFLTNPDASGVCRHFATAATALYRAAGVPARYVVGYSGSAAENETVTVTADRGHAWVEVYLDGIGWITVDPTGFGDGGENEDDNEDENKDVIVISPYVITKNYTATSHNYQDIYPDLYNSVWVKEGKEFLPEGYRIEASVIGSLTEVGVTSTVIEWYKIYDKDGNLIEGLNVVTEPGVLTVSPIEITIETGSGSQKYNGTKLTVNVYRISVGSLFAGHELTAKVTGAAVVPGTYENTITDVKITDKATGKNVTAYYNITYDLGTLEILSPGK